MTVPTVIRILAWLVAGSWFWKVFSASRGLPRIPNLLMPQFDTMPAGEPKLTVIVPARNEAAGIEGCLRSLLAQDYPHLDLIAVDDRSTDTTGALMDQIAAEHPGRLTVLHVTDLPAGWLGKTHALAFAAKQAAVLTQPDFLLFTDGDVVFRSDALRRTLVQAVRSQADHIVTVPTMLVERWDEALFLGFFQCFGLWANRPWRVEDPRALADAVGVGAFNLIRRSAYLQLGGFEAQRMDILEDLVLARRVKAAGLRQRIAFGRGLVSLHWASGATGLIEVMTKNLFAALRFHASVVLLACAWLAGFAFAPAVGLFYAPTRIPAALTAACIFWGYTLYGRQTGIPAYNAVFFPIGALLFMVTLFRSMVITLAQGGVQWRGTFYPIAELRRGAAPLFPTRRS